MLLSAVGADDHGDRALKLMNSLGLSTDLIQIAADVTTGTARVTTDEAGNPTFEIQRPAAFDKLQRDDNLLNRIESLRPDWIYFGTLAQTDSASETFLRGILARLNGVNRFYDLNLRSGHWSLDLVQRLSALATVLKLNESEAQSLFQQAFVSEEFRLEKFCRRWSTAYGIKTICVTLGSEGCAILANGKFQRFPGFAVRVVDTVGAGDGFAAAFLHGINSSWPIERTASFANALGAIIASRPGAMPEWTMEECFQLIDSHTHSSPRT